MKFPAALPWKSQKLDEKPKQEPLDHRFRPGWKRWRHRWVVIALIALEYPFTVAGLALTGIADPDTYRDKLWRDGYLNGFNSDPTTILYAYANHRPVSVPLVWSHFLTQFNLIICVLSMFLLLAKSCMIFVGWLAPVLSVVIHAVLIGLYAYSLTGQTSADTIDPKHVNNGPPWFITKSCSVVHQKSNYGYCQQAKGLFYVFVILLALFALNLLYAIYCILFAPLRASDSEKGSSPTRRTAVLDERQWEMLRVPDTPAHLKTPMTPRTRAFNALDGGVAGRDLPLRERAEAYGGYYPPPPGGKKGRW